MSIHVVHAARSEIDRFVIEFGKNAARFLDVWICQSSSKQARDDGSGE
jgi:hypothetical protein